MSEAREVQLVAGRNLNGSDLLPNVSAALKAEASFARILGAFAPSASAGRRALLYAEETPDKLVPEGSFIV